MWAPFSRGFCRPPDPPAKRPSARPKNTENQKTDGILNNKTFMFTGKLSNMSRSEAKSLIEQNSGSIVSNVTKKLDYLIVGEKPTNRKIDAAKNLKVKILDQSTWLRMLK